MYDHGSGSRTACVDGRISVEVLRVGSAAYRLLIKESDYLPNDLEIYLEIYLEIVLDEGIGLSETIHSQSTQVDSIYSTGRIDMLLIKASIRRLLL